MCETNNIGWSWWPVKKNAINNVLNVPINKEYEDLVKYWKGEISTAPSATETYNAVMQWAENHKIEKKFGFVYFMKMFEPLGLLFIMHLYMLH